MQSISIGRPPTRRWSAARNRGRYLPISISRRCPGLSNELKQKMRDRRPRSIAEAQRMDGMTPAALGIILAHIRYAEGEDRKGAA